MNNSKNQIVYLSFPTKPEVSFLLSKIARNMGMTQPELINALCIDFLEETLSVLKDKGFMENSVYEATLDILKGKNNSEELAPAPGPEGAGEP